MGSSRKRSSRRDSSSSGSSDFMNVFLMQNLMKQSSGGGGGDINPLLLMSLMGKKKNSGLSSMLTMSALSKGNNDIATLALLGGSKKTSDLLPFLLASKGGLGSLINTSSLNYFGRGKTLEDHDRITDFMCDQLRMNPHINPRTGRRINPCLNNGEYNKMVAQCDMKALARKVGGFSNSSNVFNQGTPQLYNNSIIRRNPGRFWEIYRDSNKITIKEGVKGTEGNTTVLTYNTEEEARRIETESIKNRLQRGFTM